MNFTLIGPSLYVNDRGRRFIKSEGEYVPLETPEAKAEDRYVNRHLSEGSRKYEKK